jgi:magnesium chelatase family protein
MPPATVAHATYVHRVAGLSERLHDRGSSESPLRAPHHSCSAAALRGTLQRGWRWLPGELSLAHGGVLLLDEVTEWRSAGLDTVRQAVTLDRIRILGEEHTAIEVPCAVQLIAIAQGCPCGRESKRCRCTGAQIKGHRRRIPGWLSDYRRTLP